MVCMGGKKVTGNTSEESNFQVFISINTGRWRPRRTLEKISTRDLWGILSSRIVFNQVQWHCVIHVSDLTQWEGSGCGCFNLMRFSDITNCLFPFNGIIPDLSIVTHTESMLLCKHSTDQLNHFYMIKLIIFLFLVYAWTILSFAT